jgi:hypothetical protein
MSDQTNCNEVEAEECDAYEENQEEPVAMIEEEESPPSVGPDGMAAETCTPYCPFIMIFKLKSWCTNIDQNLSYKVC